MLTVSRPQCQGELKSSAVRETTYNASRVPGLAARKAETFQCWCRAKLRASEHVRHSIAFPCDTKSKTLGVEYQSRSIIFHTPVRYPNQNWLAAWSSVAFNMFSLCCLRATDHRRLQGCKKAVLAVSQKAKCACIRLTATTTVTPHDYMH